MKHTFYKTLSYAVMHMTIAVLIAYAITGSWAIAFAIGLIEPVAQTVAYFFHERAWHKFEDKKDTKSILTSHPDHHNHLIDSVTPIGHWVEKILHRKK